MLTCLRNLAGPHVSVGLSPVGSEDGLLDPEPMAITKAVSKRRTEFAAGRRAARLALREANLPEIAIPQGHNRAPAWPDGVVGSISHDTGLAVAVVAPSKVIRFLGVDLAEASEFPPHLRDEILRTPDEQAQSGLEARMSFSAKETVFKAFYPSVGRYFGFGAVEVQPRPSENAFTVTLLENLGPVVSGTRFEGRVGEADGYLVTLLAVSP